MFLKILRTFHTQSNTSSLIAANQKSANKKQLAVRMQCANCERVRWESKSERIGNLYVKGSIPVGDVAAQALIV
jgi:hypothetical protein